MLYQQLTKTAFFAIFCLLVGGARPVYTFIAALSLEDKACLAKMPLEDPADGEEESDETTDSESDSDDDAPKVMVKKMMFFTLSGDREQALTAYRHIYAEHHPEVIIPPPKG